MPHHIADSRMTAAVAAIVALSVAVPQLDGQDVFSFRSGVELVNVTATVTDRAGRFVSDLRQSDFVVYEDDQPVEVTHFNADRVPVSLGIVLDTSGSMAGDKIANARTAIERFLDELDPEDEIFLIGFSNTVRLMQEWTMNHDAVNAALRRVHAIGGTAMYDAVVEAVPIAQGGRNRKKAVILISDGNDTNSLAHAEDVRRVVRESEVLVYAVGIDGDRPPARRIRPPSFPPVPIPFPIPGRRRPGWPGWPQLPPTMGRAGGLGRLNVVALRDITDSSGGRTEIVRTARDLDGATAAIADELTKQYFLGYSSPGHRDGRWHSIRVETRDPSLRVRARRGYLATS
jgi:Ca-activated chloride channel family protein